MNLSKQFITENDDAVFRNYEHHQHKRESRAVKARHQDMKRFCKPAKKLLSVGSGGCEPIYIGASHALDITMLSAQLLKKDGWKGDFKLGSCDELPYEDLSFDVAVCSEVIEHLPELKDVIKTFQEINRVAFRWWVDTPAIKVGEKTHKHLFNLGTLKFLTYGLDCKIIKRGRYWYIHN